MYQTCKTVFLSALMLLTAAFAAPLALAVSAPAPNAPRATYSDDEVTQAANDFFKNGASVIAPVRFGVGWRQGVSIGYMHFSPKKRINPF